MPRRLTHDGMLDALGALIGPMSDEASDLDRDEAFPTTAIRSLQEIGAFVAPLPQSFGGIGAGTEPGGTTTLVALLRGVGQGNLSAGRILEAHVNSVRLIMEFGSSTQRQDATQDVHDGHIYGLWVTDPPNAPLILETGVLRGSKGPCSGAGQVTRALVTVQSQNGATLAVIRLNGSEHIEPMRGILHGMRSCANGTVRFDSVALPPEALIGQPGDYLREPSLSTGAWRTSAVTLGGLDALVSATRQQLNRRNRAGDLQQQDRFGRIMIAHETARLWTVEAAQRGEDDDLPVADRVAYVNLARVAIETAALDIMQLVQRSLGLPAFVRPNPVERLLRDLAVYLRQPAPDAVLAEAAQHGLQQP